MEKCENNCLDMVDVSEWFQELNCESSLRGFESRHPPYKKFGTRPIEVGRLSNLIQRNPDFMVDRIGSGK